MTPPDPVQALTTYCHLLWDSAFIDQHGDVYACCHSAPGVLGNIGTTPMKAIWEAPVLAGFRKQSLDGRLQCSPACNILSPEQKAGAGRQTDHRNHPRNIWLLWGELCNIRCIMCPQDHGSRVMLDGEVLKRHIDWGEVDEVELQGGEVMAMTSGKAFYMWLTTDARKKVNVITNGLLITQAWAEHMVHSANWIQVSVNARSKAVHERVNAGSRFDRVIEGLQRLVAAKARLAGTAAIIYKYTIVPENAHEISEAIGFASDLGCDQIAFGYDRSVPRFLSEHGDVAARLRASLSAIMTAPPIVVERKRLRHLGLLGA